MATGLRSVQQGLPIASGQQTLAQFLDRWLADAVGHLPATVRISAMRNPCACTLTPRSVARRLTG